MRVIVRHALGRADDRPIPARVAALEVGDRVYAVVACERVVGTVRTTRPATIETGTGPISLSVDGDEVLAVERSPERLRGRIEALAVL